MITNHARKRFCDRYYKANKGHIAKLCEDTVKKFKGSKKQMIKHGIWSNEVHPDRTFITTDDLIIKTII